MAVMFTAIFSLVFIASFAISYGWREARLPFSTRMKGPDPGESFYKFWENEILKKIFHIDYDSWIKKRFNADLLPPPVGANFSCKPIMPTLAATVHKLTPADIGIVAALGDSITTGFGARATNLRNLYVEYRDVSFSGGGYGDLRDAATLPNILKEFNPLVSGYAHSYTPVLDFKTFPSQLNMGKSGSSSEELTEQLEELVSELKEAKLDYKGEWKLITIFVGSVDLCHHCLKDDYMATKFAARIEKALDFIMEKLPRSFVNLVQVFDVTLFNHFRSPYCNVFYRWECPCAVSPVGYYRMRVARAAFRYQQELKRLADSPRYDNLQDFAVVLQPFLVDTDIPEFDGFLDKSYFAPDCLHLSSKGHAAAAVALWNNMLEPVGMKTTKMSRHTKLHCPMDEFPYFFTKTNSREYLAMYNSQQYEAFLTPEMSTMNRLRIVSRLKETSVAAPSKHKKKKSGKSTARKIIVPIVIALCVLAFVILIAGLVVYAIKNANSVKLTLLKTGRKFMSYSSFR